MGVIHGIDSNNIQRPLLVDATGRPLVVLGAGTSNIGDVDVLTTPNAVDKYTASLLLAAASTTLAAGTNHLWVTAIPAGQGAVIKTVSYKYIGTVAGVTLLLWTKRGSTDHIHAQVTPPVSDTWYYYTPDFVLMAGDLVGVRILGATLNDDASLEVNGYTFPVV